MSVRTDIVNLNVNVNGNKAQADLNNLRKRAADVKFEMEGLKRGTAEYISKKKELAGITDEMAKLKRQIGITALTQKELVKELNTMKSLKASMQPFTDEWKKLDKEIKNVENRLYDVKNGVQGFSSFFSKIKDEVKQFGMLAAGYLGFQFLTSQFTNIIRGAGKMSDTLADIRRVAGLTEEEVNNLNSSLKQLDTRTSVQGLREITVIAGKLGVAKDDLLGFTSAVDKLVVTLGDELGDAGQITDQLGKILNVFDGKITGDNITKLANSFVELANTGSSTGGFIADFDQRLSGIAKTANLGLGALSGLGAGLEELGGRVESSATAVQKIITSIAADLPAAAKIAGKSVQDFANTFANSPEEAILQYAEGLTKNKQSFAQIVASFKDAGEEGARVIETLSKLGQSSDYLRGRIELGKKSIQESTAITEAFRIKNETFGATLDKLGKEFNRLVQSPAVTGFLQGAVNGALRFIKALQEIPNFIEQNRVALITLAAGIVLLNGAYIKAAASAIAFRVAQVYATVAAKAAAIATNLVVVAQAAYITVTNLLIGRINAATAAQRLWNLAKSAGAAGFGLLTTVIGGAVLAIGSLLSKSRELSALQKADQEVQKRAIEIYADQVTQIGILRKTIESEKTSLEQKKQAYDKLIELNPAFVNTLKLDAEGHLLGAQSIDTYVESLKNKAEAEAKYSLLVDKIKEKAQFLAELRAKNPELAKFTDSQLEGFIKNIAGQSVGLGSSMKDKVLIAAAQKMQEQFKVIETLQTDLENMNNGPSIGERFGGFFGGGTTTNATITPPKDDKQEKELEKLRKEAEEFAEEMKKLRRQIEIDGMSMDEAEVARIEDKYAELLLRAKKYSYDLLDIRKMEMTELDRLFDKFEKDRAEKAKRAAEKKAEEEADAQEKGIDRRFKNDMKYADIIVEDNNRRAKNKKKQETDDENDGEGRIRRRIQQIVEYAQTFYSVLDSLANYVNRKEQIALDKDRKANDEKKKNYKRLLDNKLLSEAQYNIKVAQLEEELANKEREIKRRQAKREKALNIFQSLINTASAVAEALPNIPLSIAVGVAGAIQTALIAATPLPEFGFGGWIKKGDKHKDPSRGIISRIERDEAIMSAAAMTDSRRYAVFGNVAQITSALNSRNGGANWAGGAKVVEMPAWRTKTPAQIDPSVPGIVARSNGSATSPAATTQATDGILLQILAEQKANTEEIKTIKTRLHAVVSIKEYREMEELYDASKKASGLNG